MDYWEQIRMFCQMDETVVLIGQIFQSAYLRGLSKSASDAVELICTQGIFDEEITLAFVFGLLPLGQLIHLSFRSQIMSWAGLELGPILQTLPL